MSSDDVFIALVPKTIEETEEFSKWSDDIDGRPLLLIEAVKEKVKKFGFISNTKNLQNGLYEKKWKNGLRLYFAVIEDNTGKDTYFR